MSKLIKTKILASANLLILLFFYTKRKGNENGTIKQREIVLLFQTRQLNPGLGCFDLFYINVESLF